MHTPEKSNLYLLLILFLLVSPSSTLPTARNLIPINSCGNIRIEPPFSLQQSNTSSPSHMLLCKSEKLYFRTSLGLFPVSSIDYKAKTLTVSHSSCSPSSQFISPSFFSAALPATATPQPNSLLLFNCNSRGKEPISSFLRNCSSFYGCRPQEKPFPCLFVNDTEKLEFRFHPKDLSCSHYRRVYGSSSSSSSSSIEGLEFGTRVSFEVPDHLPRLCDECSKPNGNCGIGLRCICHAKECSKLQ